MGSFALADPNRLRTVLLLAAPTSTCATVFGRVHEDNGPRFCRDPGGFLQHNAHLTSAPRSVTDKLQRVMNVAARLASGTRKYECTNAAAGSDENGLMSNESEGQTLLTYLLIYVCHVMQCLQTSVLVT